MAYTLIATQTLVATSGTVTFSNIPGTFKDLVIEVAHGLSSDQIVGLQFNNDTASNYSTTRLTGNGTSATSGRTTSETYIRALAFGVSSATTVGSNASVLNIMSYANTNVNKTTIERENNAASGVTAAAGLWRSTAAVTSVSFAAQVGALFAVGSTFKLWGVA